MRHHLRLLHLLLVLLLVPSVLVSFPAAAQSNPTATPTAPALPAATPTPLPSVEQVEVAPASDESRGAAPMVLDGASGSLLTEQSALAAIENTCLNDVCVFTLGDAADDAGMNYVCPGPYHGESTTDREIYLGECRESWPSGTIHDIVSGFRFPQVTLPSGAKIKRAYLDLHIDGPFGNPTTVTFAGEKRVDAPSFSGALPSLRVNNHTNEVVDWTMSDSWSWRPVPESRITPDLTSILREIIAQPGWNATFSAGKPLVIFAYDTPGRPQNGSFRRVFAWDRPGTNGQYAARLVVELEPRLSVAITDANGQPVEGLAANANGWPVLNAADSSRLANPLTVTVAITNTTDAPSNFYTNLVFGSQDGAGGGRFFVLDTPPVPECFPPDVVLDGDNDWSYTSYRINCQNFLAPGERGTLTRRLWVQPSAETTLQFDASVVDTGTAAQVSKQATLAVAQASIRPVVILPGFFGTQRASKENADEWVLDPLLWTYAPFEAQLRLLGYQDEVSIIPFAYPWYGYDTVALANQLETQLSAWWASHSRPSYVHSDQFDLVAHSTGGLIARQYAASYGTGRLHDVFFVSRPTLI